MRHSYRNFINRYAPFLLIIAVLEKPRPLSCHDITEADSLLAFKRLE
jgi:hypothetical protein